MSDGSNVSYIEGDYTLYEENGDIVKKDGNKTTYTDILGSYNDYIDYYIINPKELQNSAGGGSISDILEPFKLKYQFVVTGEKIYERKDIFMLDTNTGKINKLFPIIAKAQGGKKVHLSNRYLTNKEYGLYTVFKYIEAKDNGFYYEKEESKWFIDRYDSEGDQSTDYFYVIPLKQNQRRPNTGTTYLSESCKVTLGGGYNLQNTGAANATSGTIEISDPPSTSPSS